ncbi:hypothetical protein BDN70DRAFT_808062 [Pholiota conissans]|uniref:Mmc1 C-terminal domain-containing protein n=1 Tax=Pholiota conissans TaxID=109636 RepID=A0A9P5Z3L0_9AGAR|nr:hypothetical protein BDN70DRAFT_808062 [Pholiota conissans]
MSKALTLLNKTTQLLPRILESNVISGFPRTDETRNTWEKILSEAHEDISASSERPAKIVVCGWDEWSGSQGFVTALLADPLSSGGQTEALERRWTGRNDKIHIIHGNGLDPGPSSIRVSSNYLTQFPIPVEITEFRAPANLAGKSKAQTIINAASLEADIFVLVVNPLTTSFVELLNAQIPSNAVVVLTSCINRHDIQDVIEKTHPKTSKTPKVVSVDPRLALEGIRALQSEPHSISAIQKYQHDFTTSRLSNVTKVLQTILSVKRNSTTVRKNLALGHISEALYYSHCGILRGLKEAETAYSDAIILGGTVNEALAGAQHGFGMQDPKTGKVVLSEVDNALKQARKEMGQVMDTLTWWRMIWRVDEISGIVAAAVRQTWCHELERKLIIQTGKLVALQESLSQSGFALLAAHPTISTAVLRNSLLQLKASPHYHLTPDSLTRPLYSRRTQIIEYPTARLHVTGQRAVLGMTGGILSSVGVGWAGWLDWLLGSGEGLLGFVGMDAGTAMGVGMLGAVASIRWAIGRWEKSKKQWWKDWTRAADGLDRDLQVRSRSLGFR